MKMSCLLTVAHLSRRISDCHKVNHSPAMIVILARYNLVMHYFPTRMLIKNFTQFRPGKDMLFLVRSYKAEKVKEDSEDKVHETTLS